MTPLQQILQSWIEHIGIEDFYLNNQRIISIELENKNQIFFDIETNDETLLLYLIKNCPIINDTLCKNALKLCENHNKLATPIHCGIIDISSIFFGLKLNVNDLNIPFINDIINYLITIENEFSLLQP